jgi:hypothetical protein
LVVELIQVHGLKDSVSPEERQQVGILGIWGWIRERREGVWKGGVWGVEKSGSWTWGEVSMGSSTGSGSLFLSRSSVMYQS